MSIMEDFGFLLSRTFASTKATKRAWPFVPGKYFVLDPAAPVAVTTLGSVALSEQLAEAAPQGLCIVGKLETENIGIEKIIKNILSNPAIRFLICAGNEPPEAPERRHFARPIRERDRWRQADSRLSRHAPGCAQHHVRGGGSLPATGGFGGHDWVHRRHPHRRQDSRAGGLRA